MLRLELWGHEYLMQLGREVCDDDQDSKPRRPKEAFHAALHASGDGAHRIALAVQTRRTMYPSTGAAIVPLHDLRSHNLGIHPRFYVVYNETTDGRYMSIVLKPHAEVKNSGVEW